MSIRPLHNLLVTGGLGFIGSAFIRFVLQKTDSRVVNLDAVTYAANFENLQELESHPRYQFVEGNILNEALVQTICEEEKIQAIVHFAAESHVDRSIDSSRPFLETNILGTAALLEVVRKFPHIHFHHISTDEVYGSLGKEGFFTEESRYQPNSPYSASKASSDHLVRAYGHTYHLSHTISHCSNNYGPGQYPEKFIPLMLRNCLDRKPLPVYGNGGNVRDWIYVDDHVEGIWAVLEKAKSGSVYGFGGGTEKTNLEMLQLLIEILAEETGTDAKEYVSLIQFVTDRPGHDFRYAIDSSKAKKELGWIPKIALKEGLKKTIQERLTSTSTSQK